MGTVDRFQGQEAEAVIVSMATSGEDDMPRDAAFSLSRNRFNVAISRARCLARSSPTGSARPRGEERGGDEARKPVLLGCGLRRAKGTPEPRPGPNSHAGCDLSPRL